MGSAPRTRFLTPYTLAPSGSAASPQGYSFSADPASGMYLVAVGKLGWSVGGALTATLDGAGINAPLGQTTRNAGAFLTLYLDAGVSSAKNLVTLNEFGSTYVQVYDPHLGAGAGGIAVGGSGTVAGVPAVPTIFFGTDAGRVGVRTLAPGVDFDVAGVIRAQAFDNGAGVGRLIIADRNTNAGTPAAGALDLVPLGGADEYLWVDATGLLRIAAAQPTNATDTSGTVVGDQTSDERLKHDVRRVGMELDDELLRRVLALELEEHRYNSDSRRVVDGKPRLQHGLVIHDANRGDWWTMNCNHPDAVPTVDQAQLNGAFIGAIRALANRPRWWRRLGRMFVHRPTEVTA